MKKFMPNYLKLFIITFLLFGGTAFWNLDDIKANSTESNTELLVTVENEKQLQRIKSFLNSFDPNANVEGIEEINLLKVEASSLNQKAVLKKHLQDKFSLDNEAIGNEQDVYLEDANNQTLSSTQKAGTNSLSYLRTAQWDINNVTNQGKSYELQKGNHSIKIGLIDSGIDFNHPDLSKNILDEGQSFVPGVDDTQDILGHGTMVAGSIAANGVQLGVGPDLGLVPYKVFHDGSAESFWIIEAIIQAVEDEVDVINLSLGTYKSSKSKEDKVVIKAYEKAVKYAKKNGVLVVASAGSNGYDISKPFDQDEESLNQIHLPGGMKHVLTVAATTKENTLASYSNYGKNVDLGAPGGDYGPNFTENQVFDIGSMVLTTYPMDVQQSLFAVYMGLPKGYDFSAGSSLAAPKVAATAGLIIAEYEELHGKKPKINKIEKFLLKGAIPDKEAKKNHQFRNGIVNAYQSLQLLQ